MFEKDKAVCGSVALARDTNLPVNAARLAEAWVAAETTRRRLVQPVLHSAHRRAARLGGEFPIKVCFCETNPTEKFGNI